MNKSQLVTRVSSRTRLPRQEVDHAVDMTLECIKKYTRRRGGVRISGFGSFECVMQKPERKWNSRARRYQWSRGWKEVAFRPNRTWWRVQS
jgi:nucleoid DNA-binding protein